MADEYKIQLLSSHRVADQVHHPDLPDKENCVICISRTFPGKYTFYGLPWASFFKRNGRLSLSDIFNLDQMVKRSKGLVIKECFVVLIIIIC